MENPTLNVGEVINQKTINMTSKKQFKKPRRFPDGVARLFNPQKSGSNAEYDPKTGILIKPGTHQYQKMQERSYIPIRLTLK